MATRYLPFVLFPSREHTPRFVRYLGRHLAGAVFGMLIVYCLKDVQLMGDSHGVPELSGVAVCIALPNMPHSLFYDKSFLYHKVV